MPATSQVKSPNAFPETPQDDALPPPGNTGFPTNSKPTEGDPHLDPSFSDSVLQYFNTASPSEMQRLLNMFNTAQNAELWPQSGLALVQGTGDDQSKAALTKSPPRMDKFPAPVYDPNISPESWTPFPTSLRPSSDTPAAADLTSFSNDANYQNMLDGTDDIHSRVDSVGFDISNLMESFPELDDINWNFDDTLNNQTAGPAFSCVTPKQTDFSAVSNNSDSSHQAQSNLGSLPEIQVDGCVDPNSFVTTTFPSTDGVGFVSELTPSAASSPSIPGDPLPKKNSQDSKRKATKTTRTAVKPPQAKKRRISK